MQKTLLLLATYLFFTGINPIIAQSKKGIQDSTTVIIFNSNSSTSSSAKKKGSSESTIIKIAPLGLLSGTFPILVERRITDFFSIQAAVGVTHRNYARTLIQQNSETTAEYSWANDNNSDIAEAIGSFEARKAKIGFMASIQPRAYFASEGLDGGFIGLSFDYYRYNTEIAGITGNNNNYKHAGSMKEEFENIKDYMVHFGYQSLGSRISVEYSTAIGLRNVNGNKYAAYFNNSGGLVEGAGTYKKTGLNFNLGIKVGYHF